MCRALKVLCAASGRDRMVELKKATVSTNWELVGGASSLAELVEQVESWRPDVVVIDEPLGAEAIQAVRSARERVRIVTVGAPVEDADENASSLEEIRAAGRGLPKPGGAIGQRRPDFTGVTNTPATGSTL